MSGWWFSLSARSATRFTNATACLKSSNVNSRSSLSSASLQPGGVSGTTRIVNYARVMATTLRNTRKARAVGCTELLCEAVFRPLAHGVVLALLPLRVPPPAVVLAATGTGFAAAVELGRRDFVGAAVLLQVKTVLDNADGQLARAAGRVSVLGRYLDSESDLLVDAALFVALGRVTGQWLVALVSFLALTLVLSVDFNLERLYRRERGDRK